MQQLLTSKFIFFHWQTLLLFACYVGIRLLSFAFAPHPLLQGVLVILVVIVFSSLYFRSPQYAWRMLLAELFLGGSGHSFELAGLSIRLVLLFVFALLWFLHAQSQPEYQKHLHIPHRVYSFLLPLIGYLMFSAFRGVYFGHTISAVMQDIIPCAFYFLILPWYYLMQDTDTQEFFVRLLFVFIIGSSIFSLFTLATYSSGFFVLQDSYYHWFRDVLNGKITDMGTGFFRIVLPEHLFAVPCTILISSLLMRDEKHHRMWYFLLIASLATVLLNFSRIYFVALAVGFLVLLYKHHIRRYLVVSGITLVLAVLVFTGIHLIASGGRSPGLELFGVRVGSIVAPKTETSGAIRLALLPGITNLIQKHPVVGNGLGASFPFTHPISNDEMKTTQFDWGYLELIAELGFLGTLLYMGVLLLGTFEVIQKIRFAADSHDFYVGLLGSIAAFFVMNITSPVLFHVFGVVFFACILALCMKPNSKNPYSTHFSSAK